LPDYSCNPIIRLWNQVLPLSNNSYIDKFKFIRGHFNSDGFLRLNSPMVQRALSYGSMYISNIYREKDYNWQPHLKKTFFGFFEFNFWSPRAKCRCLPGDPPLFLPPPILNKQMRKDQTPEERQLMLDYGLLRNFKKDLMEGMK